MNRLDRVLSSLLTVSAILIAGVMLYRELAPQSRIQRVRGEDAPPVFEKRWRQLVSAGTISGDTAAQVVIIEIGDLECPACRAAQATIEAVRQRYERETSLVYVHYPLSYHRFAKPAARAAECAVKHGRFEAFVSKVYEKQDSLGLKPWASFASEAGITDSARFDSCVKEVEPVARIQAGIAAADAFGVRGTPTLFVNGWRLPKPPSVDELLEAVAAFIDGRNPYEKP
jgi:protein-disulfide isomerase